MLVLRFYTVYLLSESDRMTSTLERKEMVWTMDVLFRNRDFGNKYVQINSTYR